MVNITSQFFLGKSIVSQFSEHTKFIHNDYEHLLKPLIKMPSDESYAKIYDSEYGIYCI